MQKWLLAGVFLGVIWLAAGCMIQPIQPTDATLPIKGAAGLGDKLFPLAGNGGYDVQHYDLDLTVDVASNTITSTATLTALATSTLDTFNLDFHELIIDGLTVNGAETPYQREEDELVIDPRLPLAQNALFTVTVQYHGKPKLIKDSGWLNYFDRVAVSNGSLGAATWYPVNNTPLDKATYSFRVTVPPAYMALANGQLLGEEPDASGWTTYHWATNSPMASSTATILIGHYALHASTVDPSGLLINTYVESLVAERSLTRLEHTSEMLALLNEVVGPFPFANYNVLIHTKGTPYATMEQELTILSVGALNYYGEEAVMNGLAYQYFGNSVSRARGQDRWLTQGVGGALGWLWIEKSKGPAALQTLIQGIRTTYNLDFPPAAPATADDLDNDSMYFRGPMAINALRMRLGDERFYQLLRTFYARYRGGNASTEDFIAVAEEISGEDLTAFFQEWLYADKLPPLPEP
ncbi:MAG: M1 family metallopeptidase [Caldilineaceae bacterium]